MLGLIVTLLIAILLMLFYIAGLINRTSAFTNTNIDSYAALNKSVVKSADEVVAKWKQLSNTVSEGM